MQILDGLKFFSTTHKIIPGFYTVITTPIVLQTILYNICSVTIHSRVLP